MTIKSNSGLRCWVLLLILGVFWLSRSSVQACFSPANFCAANLRQLDAAKAVWGLDNNQDPTRKHGSILSTNDLIGPDLYIHDMPMCPLGGSYNLSDPLAPTECSLHGTAMKLNVSAHRPVPFPRFAIRLGMVLVSGIGLLLLSFSRSSDDSRDLPARFRRCLMAVSPLIMVAVTYIAAISQERFEKYDVANLSFWLTLFVSGRAVLLKAKGARLAGWIVVTLCLGVSFYDSAFLKAGECDFVTRLMLRNWHP